MDAHSLSETTLGGFLVDFGLLLGTLGDHFGGHFATCSAKRDFFEALVRDICSDSENERKWRSRWGAPHAIHPSLRSPNKVFRFPSRPPTSLQKVTIWHRFWSLWDPFGSILDNFCDLFSDWKIIYFLIDFWIPKTN